MKSKGPGRPRKNPVGNMTLLSVRIPAAFADEIDEAAQRVHSSRPPGSDPVTRSEVVKIALTEWIARQSAATKRGK
jgi:metal-responsive CopG/Arc/MetJ family transcriptional regulator